MSFLIKKKACTCHFRCDEKRVIKSIFYKDCCQKSIGFNCFEKSVNAIAEVMDVLYTQTANGQEGRDVSERRAGHSRMSADTCKFFPTLIVNTSVLLTIIINNCNRN